MALALGAGLFTWGLASTAMAADFSPLMFESVALEQSCATDYAMQLDTMLFDMRAPSCDSLRTFDFAFLAVVALIVISAIRFRHATMGRRLELARKMVERGLEPPPELLGASTGSDLRRGIVLVCTGAGLLLASMFGGRDSLSPAGLIPGFIGIGYLISHRFAVSRPSASRPNGGGK